MPGTKRRRAGWRYMGTIRRTFAAGHAPPRRNKFAEGRVKVLAAGVPAMSLLSAPLCHISLGLPPAPVYIGIQCFLPNDVNQIFLRRTVKLLLNAAPSQRLSTFCPLALPVPAPVHSRPLCYVNANVLPDSVTKPRNEEMPLSGKSYRLDSAWENSSRDCLMQLCTAAGADTAMYLGIACVVRLHGPLAWFGLRFAATVDVKRSVW